MHLNPLGLLSVAASVAGFELSYVFLRNRPVAMRVACFTGLALLTIPSVLFAVYYLHILPERAWFYELRSLRGSEFLNIFLGLAAGGFATFFRRWLRIPLMGAVTIFAATPYIKGFAGSIPDDSFGDRWDGVACLQTTPSTCGPASVCTILKWHGTDQTERVVARAAYSYSGGTEAWYLARFVRDLGFTAQFKFGRGLPDPQDLPAIAGVRMGGYGHFIAILAIEGDMIHYADPLNGEARETRDIFLRRYELSGYRMQIREPGS